MNLAKILLNSPQEFNGHKSAEFKGISLKQCIKLCKALEKLEPSYSFVCEVWTDGGVTIYQKDYWPKGKHPTGCVDRIILAVEV